MNNSSEINGIQSKQIKIKTQQKTKLEEVNKQIIEQNETFSIKKRKKRDQSENRRQDVHGKVDTHQRLFDSQDKCLM